MVMKDSGMALMGSGHASGERRAIRAVEQAFSSPLLNDVELGSAHNVLVNITSGKEKGLSMSELSQVMDYIKEYTGGVSNFKRGVVCDPAIGDAIHVTIVATGLNMSNLPDLTRYTDAPPVETVVLGEDPFSILGTGMPGAVNDHALYPQPVKALSDLPKPIVTKKGKPALILNPGDKITDFETIPAYIRQRKKIDEEGLSDVEVNPVKIEERDGKQRLSSANAYIHQMQD